MRKCICLFALCLVACSFLFAGVSSAIIPLSSSLYDSIDTLYHLKGMATPSTSRPWSLSEVEMILEKVDAASLSGAEEVLYEEALKALEKENPRWSDGEGFGFGLELDVYPEAYAHTNGEEFRTETSWAYGYNERHKALDLGIEMSISDWFYSYCSLQYTLGRYSLTNGGTIYDSTVDYPYGLGSTVSASTSYYDLDDVSLIQDCRWYFQPFTINIPSASKYFAFEWPLRAFVSFGGTDWNFFLGRDKVNWGESHVGNMIVDEHVFYHDLMRFRGYTGRFTYEWDALFFDTNPSEGETTDLEKVRMYLLHRLGFRLNDKVNFTISEDVMYQSRELSLQFLNPGMVYHNLNNRENFNAILYVDFSYAPLKGLNVYGQFALDQATAPNEDSNQDPAWGCLLGAEYTMALDKGVLSADLEVDFTSPALYRRDKLDFLMFQREFSLGCDYPIRMYYIGYPYGGDAIMLHGDVVYTVPGSYRVKAYGEFLTKGSMHMNAPHSPVSNQYPNDKYPKLDLTTPSGDPDYYLTFGLLGDMTVGEYRFGTVKANAGIWSLSAFEKTGFRQDFQFALGAGISF